jgi:hypothetical protein
MCRVEAPGTVSQMSLMCVCESVCVCACRKERMRMSLSSGKMSSLEAAAARAFDNDHVAEGGPMSRPRKEELEG